MEISRRSLFRSVGAIGGAAALGGLADEAVAGTSRIARAITARTTLDAILAKGKPGTGGWRPLVLRAGEPHLVRDGLAAAQAGRKARREPLLALAQLSDVHILDAQSPMRFESQEGISSSAYRPQEILTAHIAEAMVRELSAIGAGPVTGLPLEFALQTGDNSDNSQYNEIRWNIDILDGGKTITPDSGDLSRYEGVMDNEPGYYDVNFWHPHGTPAGETKDNPRKLFGFPVVPGLLDKARQPFEGQGIGMPWLAAMGNHDELVQGNFKHSDALNAKATGSVKGVAVGGTRTVTADPDRRLLSRSELVEEHFTTTGLPMGHGFTEENLTNGTAYYTYDHGLVRFIIMDTVNENGGSNGSFDQTQFDWLVEQLDAASDMLVVVASHHTSWTMNNTQGPVGTRILGDQVVEAFLAHENVVAWLNGHTHDNTIVAHPRDGGGGFWEINTASHIDWPQQSRLVELADNKDGTLSIFTTMVDHGAPLKPGTLGSTMKLAALGRLLAANDWQERDENRRGKKSARNTELLVPAPAFMTV